MLTPTKLTLRYLVLRFLAVTVITAIGVAVVFMALGALLGLNPSQGSGIVVAIIPAMDAGSTFARYHKRLPEKGEAWRHTFAFFAAHIVFGVAILALSSALSDGPSLLQPVVSLLRNTVGLWAIGVIMVIYLMAIGFFFRTGAKSELRRAERAAAKDKQ